MRLLISDRVWLRVQYFITLITGGLFVDSIYRHLWIWAGLWTANIVLGGTVTWRASRKLSGEPR